MSYFTLKLHPFANMLWSNVYTEDRIQSYFQNCLWFCYAHCRIKLGFICVCGNLVCSAFYGLTHIIAHSCILHQYPINFRFISNISFFLSSSWVPSSLVSQFIFAQSFYLCIKASNPKIVLSCIRKDAP